MRAHHRLVVDEQHGDRHDVTTGSCARTRNPPPGRGPRLQLATQQLDAFAQAVQPAARIPTRPVPDRRPRSARCSPPAPSPRRSRSGRPRRPLPPARACARSSTPPAPRGARCGPRRRARARRRRCGAGAPPPRPRRTRRRAAAMSVAGAAGPTEGEAPSRSPPNTPTTPRSSSRAWRPRLAQPGGRGAGRRIGGRHLQRSGLQHHQAHPVGHHVVHLGGEPRPLLQPASPRRRPFGLLPQPGEQLGPRGDVAGEDRRHHRVEQSQRDRVPRRAPTAGSRAAPARP